jgi:hypothetical protein
MSNNKMIYRDNFTAISYSRVSAFIKKDGLKISRDDWFNCCLYIKDKITSDIDDLLLTAVKSNTNFRY